MRSIKTLGNSQVGLLQNHHSVALPPQDHGMDRRHNLANDLAAFRDQAQFC